MLSYQAEKPSREGSHIPPGEKENHLQIDWGYVSSLEGSPSKVGAGSPEAEGFQVRNVLL